MTPSIVPATVFADRKITTGARFVPAPPEDIFNLLAQPSMHRVIDGSDTVQDARASGPERLSLGAKFGMDMKIGPVPYPMSSTVSRFDEYEVIEWHHWGKHRWRYELEPVDGGTMVTESFDWAPAIMPAVFYQMVGYPDRHRSSIDKTLERLAKHFEK